MDELEKVVSGFKNETSGDNMGLVSRIFKKVGNHCQSWG